MLYGILFDLVHHLSDCFVVQSFDDQLLIFGGLLVRPGGSKIYQCFISGVTV